MRDSHLICLRMEGQFFSLTDMENGPGNYPRIKKTIKFPSTIFVVYGESHCLIGLR